MFDRDELKADVEKAMQEILRLKGECVFLPTGTLADGCKTIDDQRTWD